MAEKRERAWEALMRHLLLLRAPWMAKLPDKRKKTEGNFPPWSSEPTTWSRGSTAGLRKVGVSMRINPQTMWTMPSAFAYLATQSWIPPGPSGRASTTNVDALGSGLHSSWSRLRLRCSDGFSTRILSIVRPGFGFDTKMGEVLSDA